MNTEEILKLLEHQKEWDKFRMYTDEIMVLQLNELKFSNDGTPIKPTDTEHFRAAAFYWWFKQPVSKEQIENLIKLAELDPDKAMGKAIAKEIRSELKF